MAYALMYDLNVWSWHFDFAPESDHLVFEVAIEKEADRLPGGSKHVASALSTSPESEIPSNPPSRP
jgi:hypothetical protein